MELQVERFARRDGYTIGGFYVNGKRFCDTLEDKDRGLKQDMDKIDILKTKVKSDTAIPAGRYKVIFTHSPKFGRKMPLLLDVPGFEAIRIHPGNTAADSMGCILTGKNTEKGRLTSSRVTFDALYKQMASADARGEKIFITIK